ncbi:NAD(P)-binding protein [Fomitopsis serialis]|uniref:NAD(P)-binding protein n=1 Tax=Fomitopsis serialis TaxID=139415 RepID=UPI0020074591|nr:NAD(P)-binding protein [Neoantrodia serialis]KAH9926777.1 NAD(P)-binding protein [Neoantrodia serialis]
MGATVWLVVGGLLLLVLYIRLNDAKLGRIPPEAAVLSPKRWTPEEVRRTVDELAASPASLLNEKLPPKTGRRYIITGGAGFLGGWIVLHLLARGEDPRRIRVLDIRRPIRKDLLEGAATEVDFVQADVSDAKAVQAAFEKPWPPAQSDVPGEPQPEITVFHTAATIRFFERHPELLHLSERVNVLGTQNVLDAARRVGASSFVYTSSGSISVHSSRFFLWPWEKEPRYFTQVANDDDAIIPKRHEDFFSNYAVSKYNAERVVRAADKSPSGKGVLRTGCIRPGNGIYGPGGDLLVGVYLVKRTNPTWIPNIIQSFIYVENCSLAHLCYEARLIELQNGGTNPDVGGQAFCVADAGPPATYGDVYDALTQLTNGTCVFPKLSCSTMLGIAHLVERYSLFRHFLAQSPLAALTKLIPRVSGDITFLQPSMFALTGIHLIFDDSRARSPPEKGGLGYEGRITTLEGVCKVTLEHQKDNGKGWERVVAGHKEEGHGFGLARAEKGVEEVIEKVANGVGVDPKKVLS